MGQIIYSFGLELEPNNPPRNLNEDFCNSVNHNIKPYIDQYSLTTKSILSLDNCYVAFYTIIRHWVTVFDVYGKE
jgi:hypothetical protein